MVYNSIQSTFSSGGLLSNLMGINSSLLVLFMLLIPSSTHVESTNKGFISVEIFQKGIDFTKDVLVNSGLSSLTPLELPQIEKSVKIILIGTVHITLSNIVLYQVDVSSSTVKPGDTGINFVVSGAKAFLNMSWSYTYGTWIHISDSGVASVKIEGMEVGLTVALKNQQGTLELSVLECGCHVKDIYIDLDGGASWLYQLFVDAFKKKISSAVENAISQKIKDEIIELNVLLHSLPKEIAVDKIAALNVTFVNDLVLRNSSIGLEIDGLFIARDEVVAFNHLARNSLALVSCESPATKPNMVGIAIHENVLNSASLIYFNADVMHWIVDKIPHQSLLHTSEWRFLIPQLYKQYPDKDMNLNVSITSPPVIKVGQQSIDVAIYSDVTIDVLDAGQVIPVACFSLVITGSGYPEISKNRLTGSVNLNNFNLSLKWSTIGQFHMIILKPLVQTAVRTILVPYVNLCLWRGLPLPNVRGYTLSRAQFGYMDSRVIVCSDIASLKTAQSQ